jgi:AAA family ATP:ADP antiporter
MQISGAEKFKGEAALARLAERSAGAATKTNISAAGPAQATAPAARPAAAVSGYATQPATRTVTGLRLAATPGRESEPEPRPQGFLARIFSLFTCVRAGECGGAALMGLNVFLVLTAYYLLKTVREALVLTQGGAEVKSYSAAAQALLLLILVPVYSRITSRMSRERAAMGVTAFFVTNLLMFAGAGLAGLRIGVPFFVWVGVFNVTVIAQFWAYASDVWNEEQGKRLLPVVGMGSSLGAFAGAKLAGPLFKLMGPYQIMAVAAGMLLLVVLFTRIMDRHIGRTSFKQATAAKTALAPGDGFRMVFANRYLLLIAGFVLLLNVVNTSGEFLLSRLVVQEAERVAGASAELKRQFIGQFYSNFFGWTGIAGLVIQFFLVSRVFKKIGVRAALFIVPCIALGGYALLALAPALAVVRVAKILENAGDYSIQNSARHALFLRTSREARYKAKAAIDTFFWRAGDLLQAGIVALGAHYGFTTGDFAAANMALAVIWIGVVALLFREYGPEVRRIRRAADSRHTAATTTMLLATQ